MTVMRVQILCVVTSWNIYAIVGLKWSIFLCCKRWSSLMQTAPQPISKARHGIVHLLSLNGMLFGICGMSRLCANFQVMLGRKYHLQGRGHGQRGTTYPLKAIWASRTSEK